MAKSKVLSKKRVSTSSPAEFPIVGIGASAGGLAAIEAFFSAMPADNEKGIAFVIVQHLSPRHKSILSELVTRYTHTEVYEAEDGMKVKANCTYIIPPNRDLALLNGRLQLLERAASSHGGHYPIDFFFRSLAADLHERAICIVLSGTGSDGSLGLRAVKGEGGMAMVQAPESAEFDGMPRSALATGLVDLVLPPAEMPVPLIAYVNHTASQTVKPTFAPARQNQQMLAKIAVFLRARTGHDFSQYKENTIIRRVQRRMALQQLESSADYLRFMQDNPQEVNALFRDLLIGVTSFFRDAEAFAVLEKAAIPRLFESLPGSVIRVWVCACSTGEEAYSIAILIQEHMEEKKRQCKVQIFATDIDGHATDQARQGVFPASIAADVSPERLRRFFTLEQDGSYRIHKVIRDLIIFSEQDVLKDPPFSKLGLISCRNLLIYLNADLQKRVMPLFHYALKPGGVLFLGNSETVGDVPMLFENLDRKAKIYLRKNDNARVPSLPSNLPMTATPAKRQIADKKATPRERIEQTLLRHFKAAAVLVNGRGEIVYFHGSTGNFLEPAPGEASSNILSMARQGLRQDLAAALHRAVSRNEAAYANGLRVKTNGNFITVDLTILPVAGDSGECLFVVILDEKASVEKEQALPPPSSGNAARLEQELRAKDEYIRTIIEEMETSGEELKSSNEEMQSVNEDMQSTNEELETSKEELQSVNEELATLNAELQQKVADLSRANSDIGSLLAGTGVGTLFVDQQLRITRFTPSITQAINLIHTDVGRPLAHVVSNLVDYDSLVVDVQSVLDTLIPLEIEAQTKNGSWYILGIRPYRLLSNVIEGVVITFVDITQRKLAEQKLIEAERFRHAAEIETVGIVFFRLDGAITSANNAFLVMTGYTQEDMRASLINLEVILPQESSRRSLKANNELKTLGRTTPHERQYVRKDGTRGWALFAAWRISEAEAVVYVINIRGVEAADAAGRP